MSQPFGNNQIQSRAYVALGGNAASRVGVPRQTLISAIDALDDDMVRVVAKSRLYRTPCFPPGAGPDFVNAAVIVETALPPGAVLDRLHAVERDFGRARRERWGARSLDLDLLAYDDTVLPDRATFERWRDLPPDDQKRIAPDDLVLPHPRLHERAFVLVPLAEIAPDWRHPVLHRTAAEMLNALPADQIAAIRPV